jgi:hypothetical protein
MTPVERDQVHSGAWAIIEERQLCDAQGDPLYLVVLRRGEPPVRSAQHLSAPMHSESRIER